MSESDHWPASVHAQPIITSVRNELRSHPVTEGFIGGAEPLHVERYLLRSVEVTVSGQPIAGLAVQLGGSRVREGETGQWRTSSVASQAILVPALCPTHWHYSGPVDFALFYLPDRDDGLTGQLRALAASRAEPWRFTDALVSAAAASLTDELHRGPAADPEYMARLAFVMLEQTIRALGTTQAGRLRASPTHMSRLQAVLEHIHENLGEDLSIERLAAVAQVSVPHFRRLFLEATGTPPHRHVLQQRLARARELLSTTTMPISQVALVCGFGSQSHLTASFRQSHAVTPAEYRASSRPSVPR